jgi:hypothetical protein
MKAILPVLLLASSLTLAPAQTDRLSSSENARITETGPHHRVWTRTVEEPTPYGEARRVEHRYVEMATGLNHLEDGVWKESKEEIEINQGHAVARKGQHKVIFAGDIATPGAIDLEMPGGERATMHVLGLSFFDEASGQSVLIAEVKSSTGIVDGNTVVYMDAFTDVAADIRYTYTKAGLEQDILLTERLPFTPEDFGMSSQTTVLQVLTEFATLPRVTQQVERIVQDDGREIQGEELDFGSMRMSRGDAFRFDAGRRDDRAVRVQKLLRKLDGRDFLIEQVPIRSIAEELDRLPPRTGAVSSPGSKTIPRTASLDFKLPAAPKMIAKAKAEPMLMARYKTPAKSFLLDYQTLNSTFTNVTLQADTTYYVAARTDLYGATVFEGGATIKFTNYYGADLWIQGSMTWNTGPYRPVVFTAKDDNSVGETIAGSTGSPSRQQHVGLVTVQSGTVRSARFLYARTALCPLSTFVAEDVQFVNCGNAIDAWGQPITVRNGLFSLIDYAAVASVTGFTVTGEHWTGDHVTTLVDVKAGKTLTAFNLTNSLFTACTNWVTGTNNPTINTNAVTWVASSSGVYQTVGSGNYYLADGSSCRDTGASNLSSSALALIRTRTTYPPVVVSNSPITTDTILNPQAERDVGIPDRGYHYPPLDYAVSAVTVSNGTITLGSGVAVGIFGTNGFILGTNAHVVSIGTPLAMNRLCRYRSVQEGVATWGASGSSASLFSHTTSGVDINLRFTEVSFLADPQEMRHVFRKEAALPANLVLRDSSWRGGYYYQATAAGSTTQTAGLTNNVFERSTLDFYAGVASSMPTVVTLQNSLHYGGSLSLRSPQNPNGAWRAYDNLFDGATLVKTGAVAAVSHGYNGYRGVAAWGGTGDKTLTTADYQTGPLGSYYYPTNGASGGLTNLLNAGSTWATNVGLYHFTTTTNQVKEAETKLDIGFHYVACDASGNPVDTDGEGLPDYLEDANGNGVVDSAETDWNSAGDLGLQIRITRPRPSATPAF